MTGARRSSSDPAEHLETTPAAEPHTMSVKVGSFRHDTTTGSLELVDADGQCSPTPRSARTESTFDARQIEESLTHEGARQTRTPVRPSPARDDLGAAIRSGGCGWSQQTHLDQSLSNSHRESPSSSGSPHQRHGASWYWWSPSVQAMYAASVKAGHTARSRAANGSNSARSIDHSP
jgi:hypothetical protein